MILSESDERLYAKDFYQQHRKKYFPRDLDTSLKKRGKSKEKISFKIYYKIIKTFMFIYFNELYFAKKSDMYFFFGGRLTLSLHLPRINRMNGKITRHKPILFWYERPWPAFWKYLKLRKSTSKPNIILKLDERYIKNRDPLLLTPTNKLYQQFKKEGKLYKE